MIDDITSTTKPIFVSSNEHIPSYHFWDLSVIVRSLIKDSSRWWCIESLDTSVRLCLHLPETKRTGNKQKWAHIMRDSEILRYDNKPLLEVLRYSDTLLGHSQNLYWKFWDTRRKPSIRLVETLTVFQKQLSTFLGSEQALTRTGSLQSRSLQS